MTETSDTPRVAPLIRQCTESDLGVRGRGDAARNAFDATPPDYGLVQAFKPPRLRWLRSTAHLLWLSHPFAAGM